MIPIARISLPCWTRVHLLLPKTFRVEGNWCRSSDPLQASLCEDRRFVSWHICMHVVRTMRLMMLYPKDRLAGETVKLNAAVNCKSKYNVR